MDETNLGLDQIPSHSQGHLIDGQGEGVSKLLLILQNGLPIAPIDINAGDRVKFGIYPIEAATGNI